MKCPDILKGFLPGTKQFMAPEQLPQDKFPLTNDFSKIDVWALGVLLINMLTLDFPFENAQTDYESFIVCPEEFFEQHEV